MRKRARSSLTLRIDCQLGLYRDGRGRSGSRRDIYATAGMWINTLFSSNYGRQSLRLELGVSDGTGVRRRELAGPCSNSTGAPIALPVSPSARDLCAEFLVRKKLKKGYTKARCLPLPSSSTTPCRGFEHDSCNSSVRNDSMLSPFQDGTVGGGQRGTGRKHSLTRTSSHFVLDYLGGGNWIHCRLDNAPGGFLRFAAEQLK